MSWVPGQSLAPALQSMLPSVRVEPRPAPGAIRRFLRTAAAQTGDMAYLDIVLGPDERPLRVAVPDRASLIVANVAEVVDTTVAIRRLFGAAASHIRLISFDRAEHGFQTGRTAATAHTNLGDIHLNVAYVFPEGELSLRKQQAATRAFFVPPNGVPSGHSMLDGITAHECWHQIENAFELRRFADSMEFRRALGQYFGVETLEHVVLGGERGAPPERRRAYERLVTEVSAYATKNIRETTAEMMMVWWCAPQPPPPIAVIFGQLMRQLFGVQR